VITASSGNRHLSALAPLLLLLALSACRSAPSSSEGGEGIRPENSALPEDQRGPTLAAAAAATPSAGEGWNAQQIDWQGYEAGLARAKAENKPICLVFYTTWCPHCRNYSHVFDDPKVVERAKGLVMIRANADNEQAIASKFTKDGGYIPRTFFLAPDGTLADIHAPRPKYLYFYDEHDPAPLLAAMDTAQRLAVK
jgi:thiol-disulfide isomerase/thioredoxin